ncbi:glycogen synthase [Flavicella marina]|uniref:glycogen synthase n=1 Tax=Flavicella marina TaxID=1475951 RepID=UPI00126504C3|nr:glycogen synthase [Flavicella marina]
MEIIHISAECYPIAKVGGLADVVGALPKYQNKVGKKTGVVMPYFNTKFTQNNSFKIDHRNTVSLGDLLYDFEVLILENDDLGYPLYLIKIPGLMDRENVYGYSDDTERFLAFQKAALNWIVQFHDKPEIIHCHDYHTGLIPFMMLYAHQYASLKDIPTILTIHNAQYQGQFSFDKLYYFPEYDLSNSGMLEWAQMINPLAAAVKCAWAVTTVSPSYLIELRSAANGLEWLLDNEKGKSIGILNGIDTEVWNPATDPMISKNFNKQNSLSGKKNNKMFLCDKFDLNPEKPLFAFIGRLVGEKGAELLPEIFDTILSNPELDANVLVLGSGDPGVEYSLNSIKEKHKGNYNAFIGYDETLSHIIYAGADFLVMPSRVEPCGLNQMYSLRYGTIPIVRSIGGLKDTITDISEEDGFGICHENTAVDEACIAIERACELYKDQPKFKKIRKQIMQIDHSWDKAANNYIELYNKLINK